MRGREPQRHMHGRPLQGWPVNGPVQHAAGAARGKGRHEQRGSGEDMTESAINTGKRLLRLHDLPSLGRVAFVKQDTHNDLYYRPSPASPDEVVYSSIGRTGPVGLFTALDADFIIVKTPAAPECNVWHQKVTDCRHNTMEFYENFRGAVQRGNRVFDHSPVSVDPYEVDWSVYDLVITIDIAVPTELVRRHKDTAWAYYVSEPCMSYYKESMNGPLFGYDLFLTLGFQKNRPQFQSDRIVEFPYYLQYTGCFEDLDGTPNPPRAARNRISLERHSARELTEADRAALGNRRDGLVCNAGSIRRFVAALRTCRYHLRTPGKAIWGNSLIDAATLGALVIAAPKLLKHRLMLRELWADTLDDAVRLIERLDADEAFYESCVRKQEDMVNTLCFIRPLRDLGKALARVGKLR